MTRKETLLEWFRPLFRYGSPDDLKHYPREDERDTGAFELYTKDNSYVISYAPNYLGCIASARYPRRGETWLRGNDLPDGKFSKANFDRIMAAIVGYELVWDVKEE